MSPKRIFTEADSGKTWVLRTRKRQIGTSTDRLSADDAAERRVIRAIGPRGWRPVLPGPDPFDLVQGA